MTTLAIITIVVGILLILLLSLVVYRIFYNNRANKALNTGIPLKTLSPGAILISLVFLIFIIFNVLLFTEIVNTGTTVNNLTYQNSNLEEMIEEIGNELSEQILDNTKNTYDDEFVYMGLGDSGLIFDLSFKIKSLNTGSSITVLVEDSEEDIVEYNVIKEGLTYSTDIILDVEEEYKVYIKIVSADNTFVEVIDSIVPHDVLSERFEVYPITVVFNEYQFKVTFHNQLELINSSLEGIEVDYIQLQYYNHETGEEEILVATDFNRDGQGSNYLGEAVFIEAVLTGEIEQKKDASLSVYVTIFDKDGHYYSYTVEPRYTIEIR